MITKRKRKTPDPEFTIDVEFSDIIKGYSWIYAHRKDTSYIYRSVSVSDKCPYSKQRLLHRIIMEIYLKRQLLPKEIIDHINGNGLDNRIANLRVVTVSVNAVKGKHRRNNTTGYRGVSMNSRSGTFSCEVWFEGKRVYRKSFRSKEEAALKYNKIARMYQGLEFIPNKIKAFEE